MCTRVSWRPEGAGFSHPSSDMSLPPNSTCTTSNTAPSATCRTGPTSSSRPFGCAASTYDRRLMLLSDDRRNHGNAQQSRRYRHRRPRRRSGPCRVADRTRRPSRPRRSRAAARRAAPAPPRPRSARREPNETIADYIKKNDINEAPVARGDEGSPTVDLPVPDGWEGNEANKPQGAYGADRLHRRPAPRWQTRHDHRPHVEAVGQRRPRQDPGVSPPAR